MYVAVCASADGAKAIANSEQTAQAMDTLTPAMRVRRILTTDFSSPRLRASRFCDDIEFSSHSDMGDTTIACSATASSPHNGFLLGWLALLASEADTAVP
jgi:hypothetical protein